MVHTETTRVSVQTVTADITRPPCTPLYPLVPPCTPFYRSYTSARHPSTACTHGSLSLMMAAVMVVVVVVVYVAATDPVGMSSPKFPTRDRVATDKEEGASFPLLCPAQAHPAPHTRYALALYTRSKFTFTRPSFLLFFPSYYFYFVFIYFFSPRMLCRGIRLL